MHSWLRFGTCFWPVRIIPFGKFILVGIEPDLPYQYYLDLVDLCRKIRPKALIEALHGGGDRPFR